VTQRQPVNERAKPYPLHHAVDVKLATLCRLRL
jgi:hypothetical protein